MFCRFTDDLNTLDGGKIGFFIGPELLQRHTVREPIDPVDIGKNVVEKNTDIPSLADPPGQSRTPAEFPKGTWSTVMAYPRKMRGEPVMALQPAVRHDHRPGRCTVPRRWNTGG